MKLCVYSRLAQIESGAQLHDNNVLKLYMYTYIYTYTYMYCVCADRVWRPAPR